MSTGKRLAGLLLFTTALSVPGYAFAQGTGGPPNTGAQGSLPDEEAGEVLTDTAQGTAQTQQPDAAEQEQPDVSIPGGGSTIIVTGQRRTDVARSSTQVVSVLSEEAIARTGEGDIAGALSRVTGLSTAGNGLVYVRGLGDRYSLALLNGLPLPSPEPLSRVVPLDIFPTSVIASSLVQKTYSANFPGEFGGGVINLTTKAIPDESFLEISVSGSGDEQTTFSTGYTYYGSQYDWFGFDDGSRDFGPALQGFFDSGARANDDGVDTKGILLELGNPNRILLQKNDFLPINMSGGITAGTGFDFGDTGRFGVIATASISNKWRNRRIISQSAINSDLDLDSDFVDFVTDNRILVNGLLGFGLELGEHQFRLTNLYIRDSLKRSSLSLGDDFQDNDTDLIQSTSWFERQLLDTQFVGELEFGDLSIDLRGGYAQTQREVPFDWEFTYSRTNNASDLGDLFLNTLDPQRGGAIVSFSDLTEDLYYGGIDLSYAANDWLSATVGYAYTDTKRFSTRREFDIRASTGFPDAFGAFRPDNLLGDALIELGFNPEAQAAAGLDPFEFNIFETTESDPAFDAGLEIHAAYGKLNLSPMAGLTLDVGVRYEDAVQTVSAVEVFAEPIKSDFDSSAFIANDYFLPGATLTYEITPDLQARISASKTIARPQFRELIFQTYFDPESNRQFNGNVSLIDTELTNYEARLEYYLGAGDRISVAGFYKDLENPIEIFRSFTDNEQISGFANAPAATLYGAEFEAQVTRGLYDWGGFWETKQFVVVANYTYTQSELKVAQGDVTTVNRRDQPAANFFRDGVPLTGQSDHLVNLQLGLEDQEELQQFTVLFSYASERVTSRGTSSLPDIVEDPGLRIDLVYRQGLDAFGIPLELKLEARNLTGRDHLEFQDNGTNRIDINTYEVGRSFGVGLSAEF
jgi:outer membrane receptor protein involved in Fe transport